MMPANSHPVAASGERYRTKPIGSGVITQFWSCWIRTGGRRKGYLLECSHHLRGVADLGAPREKPVKCCTKRFAHTLSWSTPRTST